MSDIDSRCYGHEPAQSQLNKLRRLLAWTQKECKKRYTIESAPDFNDWWAENHPLDWWASAPHRRGQPMNHGDRLLVRALCQRAYEASSTMSVKEGE